MENKDNQAKGHGFPSNCKSYQNLITWVGKRKGIVVFMEGVSVCNV